MLGRSFDQISILVPDLEEALEHYSLLVPESTWLIYTYTPSTVPRLEYRGEPGAFAMRIAFSDSQPQIELIQPLAGPSIYDEFITMRGYGLHHVGVVVDSIQSAIAEMEASGHRPVMAGFGHGRDGDGGFAYFELTSPAEIFVELLEPPAHRHPPTAIRRPLTSAS